MAPEPLILVGNMFELHCRRAAVGVFEIVVDVENGAAFIVQRVRHTVVSLVNVETVELVELPVLHL